MLDRRRERAAIDRVLNSVRKDFSGTLVLQGGHGTGKTSLLEYATDSAPDLRISRVIGVESEINLEFAALHQLLVPFKSLLEALPAPQRDAMKIAFGLEEGPAPDLFLVGLATLTLLSLAAEDQPLLCVIDDGHWIDRESAHVLGFAARRLYADRVGFIVAVGRAVSVAGARAASGHHGGGPARRRGPRAARLGRRRSARRPGRRPHPGRHPQ